MNLLVPIDFSHTAQKILQVVKSLASGASGVPSKVWLLHVAEPKPGFVGFGYTSGFADYGSGYVDYGPDPVALRKHVAHKFHEDHKELQKEADKLRNSGIDTTALLIQGAIIQVILSESEKLDIDMIILGSHGHGAIYNLLVGNVSEGVLKHASRPVLVIPTHDHTEKNQ
ncbi:MAG: universal stress protein [Nitrospiria bacterium]